MDTAPGDDAAGRGGLPRAGDVQHARLLVITPDPGRAGALRTRLALAGYGVEWAADAQRALAFVQAQAVDMALIALSDGESGGGEPVAFLVQALKAASEAAFLPVLLLTGTGAGAGGDWTTSGADDALEAGADDALLGLRVGTLLHLKRRYQALADSLLEVEATCAHAQQAAARYEAVFMHSPEAMLLVGADGQIAEANLCACALAGYAPGALSGQALGRLCPPELLWAGELMGGNARHSFSDPDASLATATGQIVPIDVCSVPVQPASPAAADAASGQDAPALFLVTLTDRRPERARLAHAQREAAAETATVFSREISNPLFVIASNIELLQSALAPQDSGVQAKLGRITDACRRLVQAAQPATTPSAAPPFQD